jgi:hypothetical protein
MLRKIKVSPMSGDGGAYSDKLIQIARPQIDSTIVIKETVVVSPIKH